MIMIILRSYRLMIMRIIKLIAAINYVMIRQVVTLDDLLIWDNAFVSLA
jgi:hypothetical protein